MALSQVVKVVQPSRRRTAVVGVLKEEGNTVGSGGSSTGGLLFLDSRDAKLPRCVVQPSALPPRQRAALVREARRTPGQLRAPDAAPPTLVAATLQSWDGDHAFPSAQVGSGFAGLIPALTLLASTQLSLPPRWGEGSLVSSGVPSLLWLGALWVTCCQESTGRIATLALHEEPSINRLARTKTFRQHLSDTSS